LRHSGWLPTWRITCPSGSAKPPASSAPSRSPSGRSERFTGSVALVITCSAGRRFMAAPQVDFGVPFGHRVQQVREYSVSSRRHGRETKGLTLIRAGDVASGEQRKGFVPVSRGLEQANEVSQR